MSSVWSYLAEPLIDSDKFTLNLDLMRDANGHQLPPPPWYFLCQGDREVDGYVVLLKTADGEPGRVIVAFSSEAKANEFLKAEFPDHNGFTYAAKASDWQWVTEFMHVCDEVRYLLMDPERLPDPNAYVYTLAEVGHRVIHAPPTIV